MEIRPYQQGDEVTQAHLYNEAAGRLPKFKPATAAEIARRHQASPSLATSTFFALQGDEIVGYAVFDLNGRISYPWCVPGHESAQRPLLDLILRTMKAQGLVHAWAAYRADWTAILEGFREAGFACEREMINFVADLKSVPHEVIPDGYTFETLPRTEKDVLFEWLGEGREASTRTFLDRYFWENPDFESSSLFAARRALDGRIEGVGLIIQRPAFADPTQLDSAMPCFRLGVFGEERQRHKRVNGMFSCLAHSDEMRRLLFSEAARRLEHAGLRHIAAQVSSDQAVLASFYENMFQRQGSFPILSRTLA